MMRIYFVKTLIFADFLIISARQTLSKLNIDKAKKVKKIRFYPRLYEVNPCHPRSKTLHKLHKE